jgi:hypothetical protein
MINEIDSLLYMVSGGRLTLEEMMAGDKSVRQHVSPYPNERGISLTQPLTITWTSRYHQNPFPLAHDYAKLAILNVRYVPRRQWSRKHDGNTGEAVSLTKLLDSLTTTPTTAIPVLPLQLPVIDIILSYVFPVVTHEPSPIEPLGATAVCYSD